jgi:hypothetical protein
VGVAAVPWAGAERELEPVVRADDDEDDKDEDEDEDEDEELDCLAFPESLVVVDVGAVDELSAVEVAGAVVVGEEGVVGVVPDDDEVFASSPRVVVPDEVECETSADTGFCPISSIPVTIAIATTKTETA